jgi:hypothetical protein
MEAMMKSDLEIENAAWLPLRRSLAGHIPIWHHRSFQAIGIVARKWQTFLVGIAASVGAGISMAFAEALSDDGSLTGRGAPVADAAGRSRHDCHFFSERSIFMLFLP